ncbi:MAG: pyridoxal-phosphate dependent enzyme [Chryseolinea sp.]
MNTLLTYTSAPIQEIQHVTLKEANVRLLIRREDLNHPFVTGNKWWKLKYNLEEAERLQKKTILTFGGAFSNHIYATATAAQELNLKSIGIIRGEETFPLNPTLAFSSKMNMKLHYVDRETYREKDSSEFIKHLHNTFGDFYMIPEGGTNELAVKGIAEFSKQLDIDFDYLCCAVGTGGTLAGLISELDTQKQIIGFSSLKGGDFLRQEIEQYAGRGKSNWTIETSYHFGGYGKQTQPLLDFIRTFETLHHIPLEQVYTGKMMFGVFDLIQKNYFKQGSTILAIHTGGLQGRSPDI